MIGPNESFENSLDYQIEQLEEKLNDPMLSCTCLLAYDECRKCKMIARLQKLKDSKGSEPVKCN
jgi:hypothetical protein